MKRWAHFSECGRYRWLLGRQWDPAKAFVGWCLKNPSTAGGDEEDRTSEKVIRYSQTWGYGGCIIVNPYAWISTDPSEVPSDFNLAVGPKNGVYLAQAARQCDIIVGGWGPGLPSSALFWLGRHLGEMVFFLELTKCGNPKHPLYLRSDLAPQFWGPV